MQAREIIKAETAAEGADDKPSSTTWEAWTTWEHIKEFLGRPCPGAVDETVVAPFAEMGAGAGEVVAAANAEFMAPEQEPKGVQAEEEARSNAEGEELNKAVDEASDKAEVEANAYAETYARSKAEADATLKAEEAAWANAEEETNENCLPKPPCSLGGESSDATVEGDRNIECSPLIGMPYLGLREAFQLHPVSVWHEQYFRDERIYYTNSRRQSCKLRRESRRK